MTGFFKLYSSMMLFNILLILPLNLSYFQVITIGVRRKRLQKYKNKEETGIELNVVTTVGVREKRFW